LGGGVLRKHKRRHTHEIEQSGMISSTRSETPNPTLGATGKKWKVGAVGQPKRGRGEKADATSARKPADGLLSSYPGPNPGRTGIRKLQGYHEVKDVWAREFRRRGEILGKKSTLPQKKAERRIRGSQSRIERRLEKRGISNVPIRESLRRGERELRGVSNKWK